MRIMLWADMEGMSGIDDHRQCWPAFPQYWESGRRAFTDEVSAAGTGLLAGGAERVHVVNAHGLGWPNLIWEDLPDGVVPADDAASEADFDAMLLVGFHARAGTPDGFISHTMVPGLAVLADDHPLTEPHIFAWLEGLPVLGVAGDRALGDQLDWFLEGTPFLAVKDSDSRSVTTLSSPDRAARLGALTAFATASARQRGRRPAVPRAFTFTVGMDPELAATAEGEAGLRAVRPGVLAKPANGWRRDAWPALQRAMQAALQPFLITQGGLDLSTEEAMRGQDPEALEPLRSYLSGWVTDE